VLVAEGLVTGVITGVIVYNFVQLQTGVWIGTIPQINHMVALCGSEYSYAIKNAWLNLSGQVLSVVTIVVAATLIAIEVYKYFTNYDDVGGICGLAIESEFEKCINNGILYCDDTFCGGIVGDAKGGKFNNCLNTGKIYTKEGASRGGIVGSIVGDDFFFRRQQKITITNCISTQDDPILGNDDDDSKNSEWNVAYGSGNNYRLKNNRKSNRLKFIEMQVDSAQITDGTVAFWLNNGAENRNLAVKPWRQNLSGEARDSFPVLNKNHHEVVLKDLKHKSIRTEKDLREFAKEVNDGEQFCNAILENDIEMNSDVPWTPIGTKAHCWRGSFDGQGYTISGLKCSVAKNSNEGAGLFGTVDVHADIRNVILDESCEIENNSATGAGGIVGTIRSHLCGDVLIRNCGNYGKINGYQHVGGILGRVINDTKEHSNFVQVVVDSCFNAGSVMADGYSGLLCGYMQNYGVVSNCWSNGSLKQSGRHRVFSMDNPKGEAEYFVGYYQALKIDKCYDYLSKVDWDNIVVEKKCQQGVTLKLNCTMGCTIKFDVGTGTCGNDRLTEAKPNAGIVLPKVTPLEGWTFVGWSTEKVETETDVEPKTIVGTADATYMPKENITLYAVYSKDIIADNKPLTIYNSLPENIGVTVSSAQYTTLYYSDKNL
ncbi:MAG: InlB B-repeat-containing protein, partial [Prevotella sp.]|nr:InlB B-repeat-containing protein [Prevotella sp.]